MTTTFTPPDIAAVDTGQRPEGIPTRLAGAILAAGVVAMLAGAAVLSSTGTDLWGALSDGSIDAYLAGAAAHRGALYANLVLWTFGAAALAAGGCVLARAAQPVEGPGPVLARYCYQLGGSLAVVGFVTWMGLARAAGSVDAATAEVVGFTVTRLDDLATIVLIGLGPIALASTSSWMARWLRRSAAVVGVAAAASIVALFTDASTGYGFAIVPIGLAWTLAAAVAASRNRP